MPNENPWAYNEARNRMREKDEQEKIIVLEKREDFEKWKERVRRKKSLDVFELKRRIETGRSLATLKWDIENALREGTISFETYQKTIESLEKDKKLDSLTVQFDEKKLPFSSNKLAQFLENKKFGEDPLVDILGVIYGFVVQGSALMVILLWNILVDLIKLPKDIYTEFSSR